MNTNESIYDFAMKLTTIVSGIHSLGEMVEEISGIKKFLQGVLQDSCRLLPPLSSSATSKTCQLRKLLVVLRFIRRDVMVMKSKRGRNTSYSHMRSGSHIRKVMMWLTFLFQVRGDVRAITRKTEVADVIADAADVEVEEVVTIPHKLRTMPTLEKDKSMIKCYSCGKYGLQ